MDTGSGRNENSCVVCFKDVEFCSVGVCEHSVCYECSGRMRVLLSQKECPICRKDLEHVIFTKGVRSYKEIKDKIRMYIFDPRYHIYMENGDIKRHFDKLLEARCKFCKDGDKEAVFKDFSALRTHVQRNHEVFACDLCVEHIKLFPVERRFYGRQDLAHHKRKGDKDNTSFRGHPLCQFCDKRYFDDDDLFKHLRMDHYFCHFCDADGLNHFYDTYDNLRVHFRCDHFLCEEENCKEEKFTSVFRTKIDLKAHQASVHSRLLGKHGVKQARQLDVEFNLPPRPEHRRNRDRHVDRERETQNDGHGHGETVGEAAFDPASRDIVQVPSKKQINIESSMEFPTLGLAPVGAGNGNPHENVTGLPAAPAGAGASSVNLANAQTVSQRIALSNGLNVSSKKKPAESTTKQWKNKVSGAGRLDEEFPALGPSDRPSTSGVRTSSYTVSTNGPAFNNVTVKTIGQPAKKIEVKTTKQAVPSSADFPDLPSSSSGRARAPSAWTGQGIKPKKGQGKVPAPAPLLPGRSGGSSLSNGHDDALQFVPLSFSSERSKRAYLPKKS